MNNGNEDELAAEDEISNSQNGQPASSSSSSSNERAIIKNGDSVMLQLPTGQLRLVQLNGEHNIVHLGRYGSFDPADLVGKPYGITLEIVTSRPNGQEMANGAQDDAEEADGDGVDIAQVDPVSAEASTSDINNPRKRKAAEPLDKGKTVKKKANQPQNAQRPVGSLRRMELSAVLQLDSETGATNELIRATGAKTLSTEEILAMKAAGASGREIVDRQIAEHEAFAMKNEFSKAKYTKRKESKYLTYFTVIPPTIHNITHYYFDNDPKRIRDLRPDAMAQLLAFANIRPGSRVLLVDDIGGLLLGAVLERMGGEGLCILLQAHDTPPPVHLLSAFNLPHAYKSPEVFRSLHWGLTSSSWEPANLASDQSFETQADASASAKSRLRKRFATQAAEQATRQEWIDGEFDAFISCSQFEPLSMIQHVIPALGGSASIAVHSPVVQPLSNALAELLHDPNVLNPTITEPWMRQYQVLPGRSHPEMNGTGHGGYILHATRVFNDPTLRETRFPPGSRMPKGRKKGRR